MCLAVPMEVVRIEGSSGLVRSSGLELEVGLDLLEEVQVGDYVIVHAGYAIQAVPADEAKETLAIFDRLFEGGLRI